MNINRQMRCSENFQAAVDRFFVGKTFSELGRGFDTSSIRVLGVDFLAYYRTNSEARIEDFMVQLQGSATAVIMLLPHQEVAPEFDYKSVYASRKLIKRFKFFHEFESTGTLNPIIFASDSFYLDQGIMIDASDIEVFPSTISSVENLSVKTWVGKGGMLHKSELASVDFFERSQVAQEGFFLSQFQTDFPESRFFPKLELVKYGRAIVESVRELVPGRSLNESDYGNLEIVEQFHSACLRYSKKGYFHNDLRPWNLLLDDSKIDLIDFADTSKRDNDPTGLPQVFGYLGTILVLMGKMRILPENFAPTIMGLIDWETGQHQLSEIWLNLPHRVPFSKLMVLEDPQEIAYEILNTAGVDNV